MKENIEKVCVKLEEQMSEINDLHTKEETSDVSDLIEEAYKTVRDAVSALEALKDELR